MKKTFKGWTWIPDARSDSPEQQFSVFKTKAQAHRAYAFVIAFFGGKIGKVSVTLL